MRRFVKLANADKQGKPVQINAENILWLESGNARETVITFVSDRKLVVHGLHDDVVEALDG